MDMQKYKLDNIRAVMKCVVMDVEEFCPESRERSLAITKIEEAMFWAIAAIERNEEK